MMKIKLQNRIRDDIQTLRLLLYEFKSLELNYNQEKKKKARSVDPYEPPEHINNLKELLTSSLLLHTQGLLDFWIPEIVTDYCQGLGIDPIQRSRNTNCLDWLKQVLSETLKENLTKNYDFGGKDFQKIKTFYEIRNYQVHAGGYLVDQCQKPRLSRENGVSIDSQGLFSIDYPYCEQSFNNIENFLTSLVDIV